MNAGTSLRRTLLATITNSITYETQQRDLLEREVELERLIEVVRR